MTQSNFMREFRRLMGRTPDELRRILNDESEPALTREIAAGMLADRDMIVDASGHIGQVHDRRRP